MTSGIRQTQKRNSVLLTNLSRGLCYRTWTARKTREWTEEIQRLITGEPGELRLLRISRPIVFVYIYLLFACLLEQTIANYENVSPLINDLKHLISGKWFIQPNRHGSFAPVRPDQSARWYVDGERLMADVADAIEAAADEVFITDWWLVSGMATQRGGLPDGPTGYDLCLDTIN